jgi:hypothetical protein
VTRPVVEPDAASDRKDPPSRRWVRVLLAAVVVALGAMWVYVLFIGEPQSPNVLDDETWPTRAEEVCASVAADVAGLPPARSFADIEPVEEALRQRADVGTQATALLEGQLAALRALPAPTGEHDDELLAAWFADWDTYLQDRRDHLADWRAGQDRPFAETEADTGGPISNRMDALATENRMPSCAVPGDLG